MDHPKPDYAFWSEERELTLWDASWLLCDMEPPNDYLPPAQTPRRVQRMSERLLGAGAPRHIIDPPPDRPIYDGQVSSIGHNGVLATTQAAYDRQITIPWINKAIHHKALRFRREDLSAWAEAQGKKPRFLFPQDEPANGGDMRAASKERLLLIIGLLATSLAATKGPGFRTRARPNQSALGKLILETAETEKVPTDKGTGLGSTQLSDTLSEALKQLDHQRKA